jgi:hypothetical protein
MLQQQEDQLDFTEMLVEFEDAILTMASAINMKNIEKNAKLITLIDRYCQLVRQQLHSVIDKLPLPSEAEKEKRKRQLLRIVAQIQDVCDRRRNGVSDFKIKQSYDVLYWETIKLLAFRSAEHLAIWADKNNGKVEKHWLKTAKARTRVEKIDPKTNRKYYILSECPFDSQNTNTGFDSMRGALYHATRMTLDRSCRLIVDKCPTGYGKSFNFAVMICFDYGVNPNQRDIFITESQSLKKKMTAYIQGMLSSGWFAEVFPFYAQFGENNTLFKTAAIKLGELDFSFNKSGEVSFQAFTREECANGVRGDKIYLDDLTKGRADMNKTWLHQEIVSIFDNVLSVRADGEEAMQIIAGGTCWTDEDLLNVLEKRTSDIQPLIPDKNHKYTTISEDGTSVFVSVPALDFDTDLSTFPQKYTTTFFRNERDNKLTSHEWWARCQQRPLTPDGVEFIAENLNTMEEVSPEGFYVAICDPAHASKGTNSKLTLHIYKQHGDMLDFVNCIYGKYDIEEQGYKIVDMIIQYKCLKFAFEQNTIRSFGKKYFKEWFSERGYAIELIPFDTSGEKGQNKKEKIFERRYMIKNNIRYFKKGTFALSSEMGQNMQAHYSYTPDGGDSRKISIDPTDLHRMAVDTFLNGNQQYGICTPLSFNFRRRY